MRLQDLDKFFSQKDKYKHMAFIPYKIFEKILDCLLVFSISYWKNIVFMVKKDHSQVSGGDFFDMLGPNSPTNLPDIENVEWNYDQSVQKMRQLVVRWKTLSLEMIRELYLARMNLSDRASRNQVGWG